VDELVGALLPCWSEHGLDRLRGGFHNRLADDLTPIDDPDKRLLVQTRQLFAFSIGMRLGAGPFAEEAAAHGYAFLTRHLHDTTHGGWFLTAAPDGQPLDRRKDLYAHAFAIFALSHYFRASGDAEALVLARETLALLQTHLADSEAGGFLEGADEAWHPVRGARRQNPHMHLLEAMLALAEADPESDALEQARALVGLLQGRFVNGGSGRLCELYDAQLEPLRGAEQRVEPGHHYEWVWLLQRWSALTGEPAATTQRALLDYADAHGFAHGGVVDELDAQGRVRAPGMRLWPQTERLKAVALGDSTQELETSLGYCFLHYARPDGAWHEQRDENGRVTSRTLNATSVYHVTMALLEASYALDPQMPRLT